jgi:hypothetical protein
VDLSAWRAVREMEPWTHGSSAGNSMNALFAGHDDADYYLALGGGASFLGNTGLARDAELDIHFERAESMTTRSRSSLNDALGGTGQFPSNPAVLVGDFLGASLQRRSLLGTLDVRYGVEGLTGVGGTGSGVSSARAWSSARLRFAIAGRGGALTLRAGTTVGEDIPQMLFRVGGPETVRGYDYGTRAGRSMWSGQLDLALRRSGVVSPVIFADAADTATSGRPLTSVGAGLSLFGGLMRFNVSKGLTPGEKLRFDLLFRTAR